MHKIHAKTGAIVTAMGLLISSSAFADPLAPGKPAGVHNAQMGDKEWLVFGGIAAVVAGALIISAGGGHDTVPVPTVTVVTPTTT